MRIIRILLFVLSLVFLLDQLSRGTGSSFGTYQQGHPTNSTLNIVFATWREAFRAYLPHGYSEQDVVDAVARGDFAIAEATQHPVALGAEVGPSHRKRSHGSDGGNGRQRGKQHRVIEEPEFPSPPSSGESGDEPHPDLSQDIGEPQTRLIYDTEEQVYRDYQRRGDYAMESVRNWINQGLIPVRSKCQAYVREQEDLELSKRLSRLRISSDADALTSGATRKRSGKDLRRFHSKLRRHGDHK